MDFQALRHPAHEGVERFKEKAFKLNEYVFTHPELQYKEYLAVAQYVKMLNDQGIVVQERFLGCETAFCAQIVEDKYSDIKIGILAEYDALPNLGHACGHSASGALSFLAALALYSLRDKLAGNIYLIGTPAEEFNGFKTNMAISGLFESFDYVIMMHMYNKNEPNAKFIALDGYTFTFNGKPAHASASPWEGRNAVNGMTLFMHALDMLRQHTKDGTRMHGIIMSGGSSVNTVPDKAECMYLFRYGDKNYLNEVVEIGKLAAKGCAMATQTEVEISSPGRALADLKPTPSGDIVLKSLYKEMALDIEDGIPEPLGSSDIGNLSYVCPAFHPMIAVVDQTVALHTKDFADSMLSGRTQEGIVKGAKIIVDFILTTLTDESLLKAIGEDFKACIQNPNHKN